MVKRGKYIDGRRALEEFDLRIGDVRSALSGALDDVDSAEVRQAEVQREQAEAYGTLADIRMDIVSSGVSIDELEGAEKKARRLLEAHEAYAERKQGEVDESAEKIDTLETRRREAARILDERVEAYETRVAEIETGLETDEAYLALANAFEEAGAIVTRSEQKLELARDDRKKKGAPYDDDPLFSYLWKRGFRTTNYKGRGLTKMLDGWVARLCRFDRARLNYARLTELPERLAEHVERVREEEDAARIELEAAEQSALALGGAVELEQAAQEKRRALDVIDKNIETAEADHRKVVAEHEAVLSGGKGPAAEAREVLEKALRDASFPDLRLLAAETVELDDDRIVDRLVKLRAEQMSFELDDRDLKRRPVRIQQELKTLESLRMEFKRARYDSPYARFKSSALEYALKGVVSGQLDVDRAMRALRKGLTLREPRTQQGFGGKRRSDTLGLPDEVGDILVEVLRQGSRGGWSGGGRARPTKRRRPRIKTGSRSRKKGGRKGGGFKSTGGF